MSGGFALSKESGAFFGLSPESQTASKYHKNIRPTELTLLGIRNESCGQNQNDKGGFINFSFDHETFSENNRSPLNVDEYAVNKKVLSDDIKMMHEFIEFKYFKKVMKQNNNNFE